MIAGRGGTCARWLQIALLLGSLAAMAGCGSNSTSVGITITPTGATVVLSGTQQFTGTVTGNSNTNVNWFVGTQGGTPIAGGNSTLGTISTTGLYTAPATLPDPPMVVVTAEAAAKASVMATANVTLDSGIRVQISPTAATIGTSEVFSFAATVTGTTNTSVTWSVNGQTGGSTDSGTIDVNGVYTAPSSAQDVTVTATSVADTNQTANSAVTVTAAVDPVVSTVDPATTGQGAVQQDVYLSGTGFFSTSSVLANAIPVPTYFVSTTFLRATIPTNILSTAGPVAITVKRQNGDLSAPGTLTVSPVRPAIVSSTPNSATQGGSAVSINLDGGYYSLGTTAQFNGTSHAATITSSRQLNVGLTSSDISTAGLFSLVAQNDGVPTGSPAFAATNIAIQPPASAIPTSPLATVTTGSEPVAVAVNPATGVAVIANKGDSPGTVTLIDLSTNSVIGTVAVGNAPTGVAVDNILDEAAVVNSGDNTVSVVDLSGMTVTATIPLPSTTTAYSIGVNSLSHRALVANQSSNQATILDLSTIPPSVVCVVGGTSPPNSCQPGAIVPPVGTGIAPGIAIQPQLNWAVVSPGGAGSVSIVDLGLPPSSAGQGRTPMVVANVTLQTTTQGVAINPLTNQVLFTDPINTFFTEFSLLDQTASTLIYDKGETTAAINPLTNEGISINPLAAQANILNLQTFQTLVTAIPLGANPTGVDVDPVTNEAVVANEGDNTVSILSMGPIRPLGIVQSSPATTFTSSAPLSLTVTGGGFAAGTVVRLDQTNILPTTVMPVGCTANCRELVATVPANLLATPRRFVVDAMNPDSTVTNATDLTVMESVPVGTSPSAVAIDTDTGQAVVTNAGDGTINLVDLSTGLASAPIAVGSDPEGVAVIPRLGRAIVTNYGSNNASIVDLVQGMVAATISTGNGPLGVSVEQDTATAVVANSISNSVSYIRVDTAQETGAMSVDMDPIATAIDPALNYAAVTAANQNTVLILNLANDTIVGRISNQNQPSGVVYDPISAMFIVANSLQNNLTVIDPTTLQTTSIRTGINPASLDYNFQTSTLVTANDSSNTLSVMDFVSQRVQAILPIGNSPMFSVAIDPMSNIAVVADQANNRVLLVPLPR